MPKCQKLKTYWYRRDEITVEADCLLWGFRVIVPDSLRHQLLKESLHESHLGMVKSKAVARGHFWCPKLDEDIENMISHCKICALHQKMPNIVPVHPWKWPEYPWERVHVDFCEKGNHQFLLAIDAYSRWPKIRLMSNTTAKATVEVMRIMFANFGLAKVIVSDNGPQFLAREFETFLERNGVKHVKSAAYHPASNGLVERLMQTFKQSLEKQKELDITLQHCWQVFIQLQKYSIDCDGEASIWIVSEKKN